MHRKEEGAVQRNDSRDLQSPSNIQLSIDQHASVRNNLKGLEITVPGPTQGQGWCFFPAGRQNGQSAQKVQGSVVGTVRPRLSTDPVLPKMLCYL